MDISQHTNPIEQKMVLTQESSKVLRPSSSKAFFSRLPNILGASAVAFGVGVATPQESQAGLNDAEKVAVGLVAAFGVSKVVEHVSLEEIRDRIGNVEVFISVDAQKSMKRNGLSYNKATKVIENPSRSQKIHLTAGPSVNRTDVAVQVDSAKFQGTNENQLAFTYVFVDRQGKKFGDNFVAYRDQTGIVKLTKYGATLAID